MQTLKTRINSQILVLNMHGTFFLKKKVHTLGDRQLYNGPKHSVTAQAGEVGVQT